MSSTCFQCQTIIKGRSDKKFCSATCKNAFYNAQKKDTLEVTVEIDGYLHRNRTILKQIMGTSKKEILDRLVLVRAGFHFDYMTHFYINKENKMYHFVYDYGWMAFSDQKVLIIKKIEIRASK
jgi:hypothetical protein